MSVRRSIDRPADSRGPCLARRTVLVPVSHALAILVVLSCLARPRGALAQDGLGQVQVAPAEGGNQTHAPADDDAVEPRPGIPADRRQIVVQQADQFAHSLNGDLDNFLALLRTLRPDLPPEDRRAIFRAGRRAVKEAAMRESERQFAPVEAVGASGESLVAVLGSAIASTAKNLFGIERREERTDAADPRAHIRDSLLQVVEARLGAETSREFADELVSRERRRRDVVVREVVAKLDDDLSLTDDQSEAIEQALRDEWSEAMVLVGQHATVHEGRVVYPGLPRRIVCGLLTDAQRERFGADEESDVERVNRENWMRMALFAGRRFHAPMEDSWWRQ